MKISQKYSPFEIDVKRFYVPNTTIEDECPKCRIINKKDLDGDYLSYPSANEPFDFNFHCGTCNTEWTQKIELQVVVKMVREEDDDE